MPGHTDIPAVAPTMMQPMAAPEVSESELEEGRNALRQVFQIIQVLIQQGLSEEQILEFLAQNGISEAELEEAAQVLGIDVSTLFAGTARMPMAAGGMADPLAPAPVAQTPEMVIFSLQSQINNLMQDYDMAVRNDEFTRAQGIADQIDVLQQQIIAQQDSFVPQGMRLGGKVPQENLVETKLQGLASDPVMDFAMMVVGPGKFGLAAKTVRKIDKILGDMRLDFFNRAREINNIRVDGAAAFPAIEKINKSLKKKNEQLRVLSKNPSAASYINQEMPKLMAEVSKFQ